MTEREPIKIGVSLPQFTSDPSRIIDGAQRAEAAGLDSIWAFDHLWPLTGGKTRPILECWMTLGFVARATTSIGIGSLVTRSTLRAPALLGKMAATVANIAPGRLTVAIGSGDDLSRQENEAFGWPHLDGDERIAQLIETAAFVRDHLRGVHPSFPRSPDPDPVPPLWIAGRSRGILHAAARVADGWNGWGGTPEDLAEDAATIRAHGGEGVAITWAGLVVIARDDAAARAKPGAAKADVVGGPETAAAGLRAYVDAGARHLVCVMPDAGTTGVYELLAAEVASALRAG